MIELIFVVCLDSSPARCTVERPQFQEPFVNVMACSRTGLFRAAEWAEQHPKYTVRRWKCEPRQV